MRSFRLDFILVPLTAAGLLVTAGIAIADDSQAPPVPPATQQAPAPASGSLPQQPPPPFKPGFLHQLGEWWNQGFGDFNNKMKNAKDQLDDLKNSQSTKDATQATQDALKNAAQTMVRLPSTRMFELHDKCQTAANGAPDCPSAANSACRVKGFSGGQPMGVSTSQVCSPRALMSGQMPTRADCHDETYILGVVCQ